MNRAAVLHIPLSNYAHSVSLNKLVIRLRAERGDLKKCTLYYGDRSCQTNPIDCHTLQMEVVARDELFDYFEVTLESPYTRVAYYFQLDNGVESFFYYSGRFEERVSVDRWEYYQFPFIRREDIATIPDWVRDAVVYNIFPDSFAGAHRCISNESAEREYEGMVVKSLRGGTIEGITENLDYIQSIGFNCIYLNPIFAAGEYHKYDTIDYYRIDPCFGSNEDFREMVIACHQRGMRVVIDGVFNHCGYQFFAFQDVLKNQENSPYVDWFYELDFPIHFPETMEERPRYACFGYERLMPKLNTSNKEVVTYFCDVCKHWIREYGIDGWRLDVANEIDDGFWRAFRRAAKEANKDCFLIGEVWDNASHWLQGDQFDSSMNYDFRKNLQDFIAEEGIDAYEFDARITDLLMRYKSNIFQGQLNLLDSHDVSRFLSLCHGNVERMKLAIVFQMTFSGVPSVFYGDEKAMMGTDENESRQAFDWSNDGGDLVEFYKATIALRRQYKALSEGNFETLYAKKDCGLYVYKKKLEDTNIAIAINMEETGQSISDLVGECVCLLGDEAEAIGPFGFGIYLL